MSRKNGLAALVLTEEKKSFVFELALPFDNCCVWPWQMDSLGRIKKRIIRKITAEHFGSEATLGEELFLQEGAYHVVWIPSGRGMQVLKVSKVFIGVVASIVWLNRVYLDAIEQFHEDPLSIKQSLPRFCNILMSGWMGTTLEEDAEKILHNLPSEGTNKTLVNLFQKVFCVAYTKLSKNNANKIREKRIQRTIWGSDPQSTQLCVETQNICGSKALALTQSRLREDLYIPDSEVMQAVVDIYVGHGRIIIDPHRVNWCRDEQGKLRLIDCENVYYSHEDEGDSDESLYFRDESMKRKEVQSAYRSYLCQPKEIPLTKTIRVVRFLLGVISCPDLKGVKFSRSYLVRKATDGSLCDCFSTPAFRYDDPYFYVIRSRAIIDLKQSALHAGGKTKRTPNVFAQSKRSRRASTSLLHSSSP